MKGRWGFRLLQASPLVLTVLMVSVWLLVPPGARGSGVMGLTTGMYEPGGGRVIWQQSQVFAMQALEAIERGVDPWSGTDMQADSASKVRLVASKTLSGLRQIEPPVFDEYGRPRALTDDEMDAIEVELESYEAVYDAHLAVFALPAETVAPSVVVSALADASILTADELSEFESSGTIEAIRRLGRRQATGPLLPQVEQFSMGEGDVIDGRFIGRGHVVFDGRFWETYSVLAADTAGSPLVDGGWSGPDDPAIQKAADTIARSGKGCVFVAGPVDAGPVVIRPAPGLDAGVSESLWRLLTDLPDPGVLWNPVGLWPEAHDLSGGAQIAEISLLGSGSSPRIAVLALYDTHPAIPGLWERLGRSPLMVARVYLATYLPVLLGALGVLFIASCVASPIAFRAERRNAERIEAERARERVQREAEERVVARLNVLTSRIEGVLESASADTASGVAGVSEDIESTVTELRGILAAGEQEGRSHE